MNQEIAHDLNNHIDRIMTLWETRVCAEVPAARLQNRPELIDTLPGFLANLSLAISPQSPKKTACEASEICKVHGSERATQSGYALDQVIHEYKILQSIILEVLEEHHPLPVDRRNIILSSILGGVEQASTAFFRTQQDTREAFVLSLTHDLRGPLTAIKAGAQLILRYPEKSEFSSKYASRIVDGVNRTDKMIRDVLDAHRVRIGGRLPLDIEECNLNEIALDVCHDLATIHTERFILNSPERVQGFWCSEALRRVLENLLTNAIKYGDHDANVTVTIRELTEEKRVELAVHNVGKVLRPEEMAILFEAHQRTASAKASRERGWGLGLTLVRGVAEAHGGSIRVGSSSEEGTIFTLNLPLDSRPFQPKETPAD